MKRMTAQRRAILDLINASERHWDAEGLARALSDAGVEIGIATVYRGLAMLEAQGLVSSVVLDGKKRYERADKAHHDHMLCLACGRIEEFTHAEIEALQAKVAREKGFALTGHQLVMFGYCSRCAGKGRGA